MESNTSTNNIPSDQEVLDAFLKAQEECPDLGRNEVLAKVKSANGWSISNRHLKKVIDPDRALKVPVARSPIALPSYALAAQQKYKDESTRSFKLYGRGEYEDGVSPNGDQQIKIDIMHQRLLDAKCPGPMDDITKTSSEGHGLCKRCGISTGVQRKRLT